MKSNLLFSFTFAFLLGICAFAQEGPNEICGSDDRFSSGE